MQAIIKSRLRAVAVGRVQGVGYRYFVQDVAFELRLTGYVRNLRNGNVEVVAEGERTSLEILEANLKEGPFSARVDQLIAVWLPCKDAFKDFTIAHTL